MNTMPNPQQNPPSSERKCQERFDAYAAAMHAWEDRPLDRTRAHTALVRFMLWLDAFLPAHMEDRPAHFARHAATRAQGLGLEHADMVTAYARAFGPDARDKTPGVAA